MGKIYRFTLDKKHSKLIEVLDSVPKPLRGHFIISALELYINSITAQYGIFQTENQNPSVRRENQKLNLRKTFEEMEE